MAELDLAGAAIAAEFRRQTPALTRTVAGVHPVYADAPGGTQMPQPVIDAMTGYITAGMANRHGEFATSAETEQLLARCREQVRALLNADGYAIVFGQNMTSLTFALATSLARDWGPGQSAGQVTVSELDHHANVDPWRSVAGDRGLRLAWLPVDTGRLCLDEDRLEQVIADQCAVTAVGLASNAVGTITDVARIARHTHEAGGIVVVDAVHAVPHLPVDVAALGADVLLCSAYKFFGPHVGVMAIREDLLDRIRFYKVAPAADRGPDKAELGSQNHEAVAGLSAAISFLASLGSGATLHDRLVFTITALASYEEAVAARLGAELAAIPGVRLHRAPDPQPKTPTMAFTVDGVPPGEVARRCAGRGVFVTSGDFYASTLASRLGLATTGGWVRAGLAPYLGEQDVTRVAAAVADAAATGSIRKTA
jgi:cysteine desulfurase family protein (TIGR01976 family)